MPLTLKFRPDRKSYYIRGTVRGVHIRESCETDDYETAEAYRAKREWEVLQGTVFGTKPESTFLEGVAIYLENGGERRFLQPLIDHFGSTLISKINQAAIDAAAIKIYPGLAPATLSRQLYTPVAAVINRAALAGICSPIRITRPKAPKGRVRWITHDEARRLIESAAPNLRPLIAFLLFTGARIGEALWIDWRCIDLQRGQVQFLDTKNGTDRGVPLHPEAIAELAALPHREGCVFRKEGRAIRGHNSGEIIGYEIGEPYAPLNEDDDRDVSAGSRIKKGFKGACTRAKILDFSPHDCRHTWATWHYQENRDLNMLMHLGGWSTLQMVLRYAHVNVAHAAPSITAMPSIRGTSIPGPVVPLNETEERKAK
jgi:integrase